MKLHSFCKGLRTLFNFQTSTPFLLGIIFSTLTLAQTNLLTDGNFVDTSGWSSTSGFETCSGGGGNGVNNKPCISNNTLTFSFPSGTSVSQTVNISSAANLELTMNHLAGWFSDGFTVTLSANNGQSAQISCSNGCSNSSINLLLAKASLAGATTATVTITDTTGNGWDGNYGAQFMNALLFYLNNGPTTADTQASLQNTAQSLQGIYTLQNTVLANSFSYDCNVFGENDVCVSAGGRNTAVSAQSGLNNTSALLIGAYRALANVRIGGYADQNLSVNNAGTGINLGNNTPLLGVFAAWNENTDGTGTEVKVSAAYGQKNTTITRQVVGTSEAGSGSSQLNSQGAQITAKYGFAVADNTLVSPYIGMRYTQNNMGGYSEAATSSVTAPLTYSALNTNATTALAGVGISYQGIPQTHLFASAGVETDTNTSNGALSATGVSGLTPVNFNPNPVTTRPTAMLGASYDIEKNQRIGITGIYRQEAYQATASTTVMATYTVGL